MGLGRNRKPRNFATFHLLPRPGAADASDRVFVRVDGNPYSVPGFADDDCDYGVIPSSAAAAAGGDESNPSYSSAADGALPEHVRREILELGLPDDGYDYLLHLREIRPSLSSSGGGSSAAFLPSRRPARFGLPLNVKAYDARLVVAGTDKLAAAAAVRRVEEAIDLDVAELLEESDVPPGAPEDEVLEEDFVVHANQPEEEEEVDVEDDRLEDAESNEGVPLLPDEQSEMELRMRKSMPYELEERRTGRYGRGMPGFLNKSMDQETLLWSKEKPLIYRIWSVKPFW